MIYQIHVETLVIIGLVGVVFLWMMWNYISRKRLRKKYDPSMNKTKKLEDGTKVS